MYFVYSKTIDDRKFWEADNIKVYGGFNTHTEAEKLQKELGRNFILNQTESGYKSRIENNDILVISKDIINISKGWVWNSTYITKKDEISFHITYITKKNEIIDVKPEPKKENIVNHNVNMIKVMKELKEALQKKYSSQIITEDE